MTVPFPVFRFVFCACMTLRLPSPILCSASFEAYLMFQSTVLPLPISMPAPLKVTLLFPSALTVYFLFSSKINPPYPRSRFSFNEILPPPENTRSLFWSFLFFSISWVVLPIVILPPPMVAVLLSILTFWINSCFNSLVVLESNGVTYVFCVFPFPIIPWVVPSRTHLSSLWSNTYTPDPLSPLVVKLVKYESFSYSTLLPPTVFARKLVIWNSDALNRSAWYVWDVFIPEKVVFPEPTRKPMISFFPFPTSTPYLSIIFWLFSL